MRGKRGKFERGQNEREIELGLGRKRQRDKERKRLRLMRKFWLEEVPRECESHACMRLEKMT